MIKFVNVDLRYRPNTELALRGISFEVKPGQKVGIVGRTGAGKSTLCTALTRLVEIERGQILIDGVDISKIDLKTLR